jgi:hypothetical protein
MITTLVITELISFILMIIFFILSFKYFNIKSHTDENIEFSLKMMQISMIFCFLFLISSSAIVVLF